MPAELDGPVLFVLLDQYAPLFLTIIVLCGIVGASMSTANGAILATASVSVRNLGGVRRVHIEGQADPLLRATRLMMVPMTIASIAFAIYVKQTGILLTLAFDLLLACLIVPFILGLFWRRGTAAAAMAVDRGRSGGAAGAVRDDADDVRRRQHDPVHPQRAHRCVVRRLADVHRVRRRRWSPIVVVALLPSRRRRCAVWTSRWPRTSTRRSPGAEQVRAGPRQCGVGATVDHGTVSTPSRIRRRGGSTGKPPFLSRSGSSIARQRTRGPKTPCPAALAHA